MDSEEANCTLPRCNESFRIYGPGVDESLEKLQHDCDAEEVTLSGKRTENTWQHLMSEYSFLFRLASDISNFFGGFFMENKHELKKTMGLGAAMAAVIGSVIGSGVFFKPQAMYTITGGAPGLAMLAWIVTGIICIFAAMTFAEIAILIPETGGIPVYLTKVFGPKVGFLAGWMQTVLFYPAMTAALAVATAQQAVIYVGDKLLVPIAIIVIIILSFLNCLGSKVGSGVQVVSTVAKLIPLFILMIFGFIKGGSGAGVFSPVIGDDLNPITCMGQLMIAVLFAFEGWTNAGAIAGEMKNPAKDLPIAIVGGVSIITAIYLVINIAYLQVIPADELANLSAPAGAVAIKLFGDMGGAFISVGIMISTFGACNAFILSGSRVAYFMSSEGNLPKSEFLAKLNKAQVPSNSIILIGFIGALMAISGQFNMLTDLAIFSCWTFYTLTFIAVIMYRKQAPELERSYKVPLYPVIPVIAILSGLFVLINQLFMSGLTATMLSCFSIAITVIGLPVYMVLHKDK